MILEWYPALLVLALLGFLGLMRSVLYPLRHLLTIMAFLALCVLLAQNAAGSRRWLGKLGWEQGWALAQEWLRP